MKERAYLPNESELLLLAAQGDSNAYTQLYEFYIPRLYKYIYGINRSKEDTEEILHDLFLALWENRADLAATRMFGGYVFRIARNRLLNLHKHQVIGRKVIDHLMLQTSENDTADQRLNYQQYQSIIQKAIDTMPPRRREVYKMNVQQELSYDEIASSLGISRSMVKKQIYAARDHIRAYITLHAGIVTVIISAASGVAQYH